jgi:hypothetical protein
MSTELHRKAKEDIMISRIVCTLAVTCALVAAAGTASASASNTEVADLNEDMLEFLNAARVLNDNTDRFYISDMAVQQITRQWGHWNDEWLQDPETSNLIGSCYTRFIFAHYYLNNPSWVEWGIIELATLLPAYKSHVDTSTALSYGEQLQFIEDDWLDKFAECNTFNELIPLKKLVDNPIQFKVRSGILSDEDKYVLRTAERFLNRRLNENAQYTYFYTPRGEYQIYDRKQLVFPKEFSATGDTAQFIYLTPNYRFNFQPVVQVFSDTGVFYDTLSPSEFELVRIDEGRLFEFENLEFGRYLLGVKPPYSLVDKHPNKLIIPKEEFGSDYLQEDSELFDKTEYEVIIVGDNETLLYPHVEKVARLQDDSDGSQKKDKKKRKKK